MPRAIALPAFALLLVLGCADEARHETAPVPKKTVADGLDERIDTYFTRAVPFGFSGAVLVATKNGVVLEKGYGLANRSTGVPNDSDTVFSVGSTTKQFTAAAIMKLEMMGRLNTDDLISKSLPGVPEDKQNITIHHLLTHTAGFGGATGPDFVIANRDESGSAIPHPAPTQLVPKEESLLVGYHLGIGKATTIAFENAEGAAMIVLSDGRATLEASRVEEP